MKTTLPVLTAPLVAIAAFGCGKGEPKPAADAVTDAPANDAKADVRLADTPTASDAQPDAAADVDYGKPGERVKVDLAPHLVGAKEPGVYARKITDAKDLVGGAAASGRIGDYAIGNDDVHYVIQGDDRHQGPCPWGGTLIDASVPAGGGKFREDNVGEYCLLFHLGRTIKPDKIEVLQNGDGTGAAVIAVTGPDTENDFIHLTGLIAGFVGSDAIQLPLDPDQDLPVTITRYFLLHSHTKVLTVVTAIRNDGATPIVTEVGELADSGGAVEFFNPISSKNGFGYGGFAAEPVSFLAFRGEQTSHLLAPSPAADGGPGGAYLSISGVAGMLFGATDLLGLLLTSPEEFAKKPGVVVIAPGKAHVFSHQHVVGTGDLGTLTGPLWQARKQQAGNVAGEAVDVGGKPVAGVRISAILTDKTPRTVTQYVSGPDGKFGGRLLPGTYTFAGDAPGRALATAGKATVAAGDEKPVTPKVTFTAQGLLSIKVADTNGSPSPAKVTVVCDGACPVPQTSLHRDVSFDKKPEDLDAGDGKKASVADIAFVPPSGVLDLPLAPGTYTVTLSRGPTWSLWPQGAGAVTGGQKVTVPAGGSAKFDAVLAKVIDTSGHLSGDFHVHAINSPDAPVPNLDRVLSFAAEGVDVMVSTDHDYVTDFAPFVAEAKAGKVLAAIPGVELTTFDYGHYNGFPMPVKAGDVNGGAPDWGKGLDLGMTPQEIAEALGSKEKGRVVQINHPEGGYLKAIQIDVLTGVTKADPAKFRMPPVKPDPKTGDTGLFTTAFTAIELLNGYGIEKFNSCASWWMPLLSRGIRFTGTGVSDTHNWTSSQSGGPRSWVRVGNDKAVIEGFDVNHFALQVNAGKVVGSNGPFVRVRATTEGNAAVHEVGDTLQLPKDVALPALVTIEVEIQAPEWMPFDTVELHRDVTSTAPVPGEVNKVAPKPKQKATFTLGKDDLQPAWDGHKEAKRWVKKVTFHELVAKDAWFVVYVNGGQKLPVALVSGRGAQPFAFSNPVYVDVDGGGYDKTALPKNPVPPPPPPKSGKADAGKSALMWRKAAIPRAPTLADFLRMKAEHDH